MAGRGYGGRRETWRDRGSSIFTDEDDRRDRTWGRSEERGFLERAGDELRSWFGDEEAERRRERDLRRESGERGRDMPRRRGAFSGWEADRDRERSGTDRYAFEGPETWDDNYRRWRAAQMERFDREYADYCRERQQQFARDFDSWRTSRLTAGGTAHTGDSIVETASVTEGMIEAEPSGVEGEAAPSARGRGRSGS